MSEEKNTGIKLDVRAYPLKEPKGNILANASVTINDMFAVKGIRVMNSEKGMFAAMPSMKYNNEYHEVCFPVTKEMRKLLNDVIVGAYKAALLDQDKEKESVAGKIKNADKTPKEPKEKPDKKKSEPER